MTYHEFLMLTVCLTPLTLDQISELTEWSYNATYRRSIRMRELLDSFSDPKHDPNSRGRPHRVYQTNEMGRTLLRTHCLERVKMFTELLAKLG